MRQQCHLSLRGAGQRRFPGSRNQFDRYRSAGREAHLRWVGAGSPRTLARDRQRWYDAARAGRERPWRLRVYQWRCDVHRDLEREQLELVRRHRCRARPAQPRRRLRLRLRRGGVATRRRGGTDGVQPGLRASVQPGCGDRPDDVRADGEERAHADLPHRRHRQRRWYQRRACVQLLAHRQRQPAGGGAARLAGGGGNCAGQCWYDQEVYTPPDMPDTVYVLGSNQYGEQPCNTNGVGCGIGRSNGREALYSDTAGDPDGANNLRTFTDLSYDATINHPTWCAYAPYFDNGCVNAPNGIHPDQHVIAINPANPTQIFEGSDGGLIRTSGTFVDISAQCDEPHRNGGGPLPATSGSYTACKRLLSRVPSLIEHIDKKLSSTLQFINVAINPSDQCKVTGGTQDNGTWSNLDGCNNKTWTQIIYGDGGNAGYDATMSTWRFNEFTSGFSDSNFRDGDPEKWVITSAPVVNSGEGPAFYWPQIGDPNPLPGTHPIYSGAKHVWRTWAFGAGTAGHVPQDKTPDIAGYELNCPEFVVSGAQDGCGDYRPLGGPYCDGFASTLTIPSCINQPGDLTGTVYGDDRSGGSMSWLARDAADHGTLWAATSAGRIFVTHNADAADPATVLWHRIDNATSPTRFPSGIYVDPGDAGHAWVTYSGYNAATPSTPGHVFEVRENGSAPGSGIFKNLNVEAGTAAYPTPYNDGDLPVSDVVRDDAAQTLYVSTDFGVLRGDRDGTRGWHVTVGMPRYEVMHLEIQPSSRVATCTGGPAQCKRVLYAATHSRGIWQMELGNGGNQS